MRVVFVDVALPQYRVSFFESARACLAKRDVQFDLIVSELDQERAAKGDEVHLGWERRVNTRYIRIGPINAIWQPVLRDIWNCDLAIVDPQNRRLVNYVVQVFGSFRPSRLAFCGHGRNFQAGPETTFAECWKRLWATHCDWWFAYTEGTGKLIESYGFPPERITVFHNAIDTAALRRGHTAIGAEELAGLRRELGIDTVHVAVYVGALYDHKRLGFLIEAAKEMRRRVPDFVLIIVGNGVDRQMVETAVATHPWVRYLGPRFGREKAAILKLGRAFVMPGAVGLAILDGSAVGIPIVTTAYPYHGPEIDYLRSGENGLMVDDWRSPTAYADAVIALLYDDAFRAKLAAGARRMAETYTIEHMVQRFCDGVLAALAAPRRE